MVDVKRYDNSQEKVWNEFVGLAKNRIFMFDRGYMDYHSDRFKDHSLMLYNDDELVALLPACEIDGALVSHAGLTYGGFITNVRMKQHTMNECFEALVDYSRSNHWSKILYKTLPHIYHLQPAEEDMFSLFAHGAIVENVDVSTVVNLTSPIKMAKGRKAQISKAKREGVHVEILSDYESYEKFISLENEVLESRHDTHAVHTAKELKLLHDRFPDNIVLYGAFYNDELIAGTVIYVYDEVVHTQYMAANDEARNLGALDLAISTVMEKYKNEKKWMDFGISTEHGRIYLNEGLVAQKEGFGGRTNTYCIWKLPLDGC